MSKQPLKSKKSMSTSPNKNDDFVTKTTKHRKKPPQVVSVATKKLSTGTSIHTDETTVTPTTSKNSSNISLRPRTMFAMKGRGRTESEESAYRPQWSKDGEGFVSSSSSTGGSGLPSSKDVATGADDDQRGDRRKNKVLRYSKEELLALHVTTTELPTFLLETTVASDHSLLPVSTLPFDHEEIYKQWALNRNRGRGRGRSNAAPGGVQGTRGHQRGEETDGSTKQQRDDDHHRHNERDATWQRGLKITEGSRKDDGWDDVLEPGADSNEMDLSSMAEAAEKFRREMDAMREELQGPKVDPDEIKDDLDAFDKKLEDAAAAGQFDDSDNEEAPWDDPGPSSDVQHTDTSASGLLEDDTAKLLERQSSGSLLSGAVESADVQHVLELKSSFSPSQMPADEGFAGLSSLEDEWFYLDPQGLQQGPFKTTEMREWFEAGYFKPHLPIRFGQEGVFTALANQFVHGQIPFAAPPPRVGGSEGMHVDPRQSEQQRLLELQQEQQRQQQEQMIQLQQQRILQLNQEEKIRMEMQRLEVARQQQQTQLYQQQQILQHQQGQQRQQQQQMLQHQQEQQRQQQEQQILVQQQSSWQHSQREGIMSALGMFGRNQNDVARNDNVIGDGMQTQFRSDYHTQHQMSMQNPQPFVQDAMFLKNEVQRRGQAFWPNAAPEMIGSENVTSLLGGLQAAHPSTKSMAPEFSQPPAPKSPVPAAVPGAWGARSNAPECPPTLSVIQTEDKRRAVLEARSSDGQFKAQHEKPKNASPVKYSKKDTKLDEGNEKKSPSPSRQNGNCSEKSKGEAHAWAPATMSTKSKSLKEIQQEEQRELLNKMNDDNGNTANLAEMGAQLKMMLGVDSMAVTANTSSAPPAPVSKPAHTGPWGTPAAVTKSNTSKSMRDILAEEERLAQERARANENAPASSHWVNIVAGNKVAAAATIPKPSRSVLGPVPASVLKSRQQVRAPDGAPKASPQKTERDASFWNFGAAQLAGSESASNGAQGDSLNAFGSSNVSSDFMDWALKQLKAIDSDANVTLLEYCASVEDPGEIREYLAAYLGSTPRVSAFATEFIQRKRMRHNGKKSLQQRASETGSSNKRGRRQSKGQHIDPSLLNYSVGR